MTSLAQHPILAETLKGSTGKLPVLFTSHGSPMDIPLSREKRPFWKALFDLGQGLRSRHEIKAVLVVSAHWCTTGTLVNISKVPEQIYDYYGFPDEYYTVKYKAPGAPEVAREVSKRIPAVKETTEWGLDHGAWPMLMHLFPNGDVPVFQMSLDYHAHPSVHYELGKQLRPLREKGVLIVGSGSLIHNLPMAMRKMQTGDMTPYGFEAEYDAWLKKEILSRNDDAMVHYLTSHKLGPTASPTPDHFVPVLYSLGATDRGEELSFFYETMGGLPAFSERSFRIG